MYSWRSHRTILRCMAYRCITMAFTQTTTNTTTTTATTTTIADVAKSAINICRCFCLIFTLVLLLRLLFFFCSLYIVFFSSLSFFVPIILICMCAYAFRCASRVCVMRDPFYFLFLYQEKVIARKRQRIQPACVSAYEKYLWILCTSLESSTLYTLKKKKKKNKDNNNELPREENTTE